MPTVIKNENRAKDFEAQIKYGNKQRLNEY